MPIEFLTMLSLELDMLEGDILEVPDPVQDGETVRGELSLELRKLYTVWKNLGKSAGALENELHWGAPDPDKFAKVHELKTKASYINGLLWIAIMDDLHLWGLKESLAIRTGWKVISRPAQEIPPFFRFLQDLGGGG